MPTTVLYNFPYPALSDAPNGPVQIQALAQAVENKISTIDNSIAIATLAPAVENELLIYSTAVQRPTIQTFVTTTEEAVNFVEPTAGDDRGNMFDAANPTRVTIRLAGTYLIKWNGALAVAVTSTYRACRLRLNGGSTTILDQRFMSLANSGTPFHLCGERRFALNDYVEVLLYHENGSSLNLDPTVLMPRLTVRRVGP